jgi:hypothetical protein
LKHIRFSPVNGDAGCRSPHLERQRCKSQQELSFASTFIVEIGAFAEQESLNLLAKPVEAKIPD